MLKLRLATTLMFNDGVLFRTKRFVPDYRYTVNFVDLNLSDEVTLIDISRDRDPARFYAVLERFSASALPTTAGGGITTVEEGRVLMQNCAVEALIIGRAASERLIGNLVSRLGSQAVIAAVDFNEHGMARGVPAAEYAAQVVSWGAGGIYLQSIERDGSLRGYDLDVLKSVCQATNVPVTAGNGCGNWQHLIEGYRVGASACALTSIFHHTATSLKAARAACIEAGLPMRKIDGNSLLKVSDAIQQAQDRL